MTTSLDKTLKRELRIGDRAYILAISPLTLKLTPKGKRKGLELNWEALVNGDAALATALNASVGKFSAEPRPRREAGHPDAGAKMDDPGEASMQNAKLSRRVKTEPR
jgi:hypothetical protein